MSMLISTSAPEVTVTHVLDRDHIAFLVAEVKRDADRTRIAAEETALAYGLSATEAAQEGDLAYATRISSVISSLDALMDAGEQDSSVNAMYAAVVGALVS